MLNQIAILILLSLSLFAFKCLYLFSKSNGLFDHFGKAVKSEILPPGVPLKPLTTNGFLPMLDWQIKAPAAFAASFAGDGSHPDTTLAGFLFLGAWGPSWALIILESFRTCNAGRLVSYISIPGILIFNHSHALVTPLYLAFYIATSPSSSNPTTDGLFIEASHLNAIPLSFVLGYAVPIVLMALPAPSVVSMTFKHTACGWYQQWNLVIAFFHYLLVFLQKPVHSPGRTSEETTLTLLRGVYGFAFAMAAIPYWVVTVISCFAGLWPTLFRPGIADVLHPRNLLLPKLPSSRRQVKSMAQGFMWLIQWDGVIGTASMIVWAATLYMKAHISVSGTHEWTSMLWRMIVCLFAGGPMGVAIGLLWERDQIALGAK